LKVHELQLDAKNANKSTKRGAKLVMNSLSRFGAGRSILIDRNGRVIAGNQTVTGLAQQQLYYVYVADPNLTGGNLTPVATQNKADYLGKLGYFFIDSIVTPYAASGSGNGGSGGGTTSTRYYPNSSNPPMK